MMASDGVDMPKTKKEKLGCGVASWSSKSMIFKELLFDKAINIFKF